MYDLTIDEKIHCAEYDARLKAAEKYFYDEGLAKRTLGFSVVRRNTHHWDIIAPSVPGQASAFMKANPRGFTSQKDGDRERAFRIRGEPGNVCVLDERWNPHQPHPRETLIFRSMAAAMLWVSEELMQEPAQP